MATHPIIAALDAGGTSFKCALVTADGSILSDWSVPTKDPAKTLTDCARQFHAQIDALGTAPLALGIASFGPIELDPDAPGYGTITGTAKLGWKGVALGPELAHALQLPLYLDTDVNGALFAEQRWGAAKGALSAAYMTVGTGIGVGLYLNGDLVGRPTHPEFGHIRVARHLHDLEFEGVCAIHGDCLEGLASAEAMRARWGTPERLSGAHEGWEIEAYYLAQACLNLYLGTRLERIILGGGLMQSPQLLGQVCATFDELIADYLPVAGAQLIVSPALGPHAGVLGGASVALNALSL